MKKTEMLMLALIALSFAVAIYSYPQMPEQVASHWNAAGDVDGYMGRFWGVFLMPIIAAIMFPLYLVIPKIDPLRKNIEKFRSHYEWFILMVIAFLFYIYLLTTGWNFGMRFDMTRALIPAFAALFYYCGVVIEKAKRNWFIGIRTPWTLSSDVVWEKTHKLGGKLFKIAGVVSLLGLLSKDYAIWIMVAPVLAFSLYMVLYSYLEWRKVKK